MIGPWHEDDVGASFLLTGQKGTGKTSWLGRVQADGIPVTRIALAQRLLTKRRLAQVLAEELEIALENEPGLTEIRKALNAGPKRIVTVDRAQNLFLAMVGGYDTFEAFVSLVEETCDRVFWVCAVNAFAWDHLFAVRPDLMVFRHHEVLTGWSEEDIGLLLQTRNAATGVEVVYGNLGVRVDWASEILFCSPNSTIAPTAVCR